MDAALTQTRTRPSPLRSALLLLIALGGLVCFILGLGDIRRQRYAVEQARWHAAQFQKRVGDGGLLPLNLEPEAAPTGVTQMIPLQWPDHQAASALRERTGKILVAQSVRISQSIRSDGRAVIFFDKGRFEAVWMTEPEFAAITKPGVPAP